MAFDKLLTQNIDGTKSELSNTDLLAISPLVTLNEGNGNGIVRRNRAATSYGNIGSLAVDLSISTSSSATSGATGAFSAAFNQGTVASGESSVAFNFYTTASGLYSAAFNENANASGKNSAAFGRSTQATTAESAAFGRYNIAGNLFSVGNGTYITPANAFQIADSGEATFSNYLKVQDGEIRMSTSNTSVGYRAGAGGSNVTALGASAAEDNTGSNVTAIGLNAAYTNTGSDVTAIGAFAANTNTGSKVTALGESAGFGNTGSSVTAIGSSAAYLNTGSNVTALGEGAANTNTGSNVTAIGDSAGLNNIFNYVSLIGEKTSATANNQVSFGGATILGANLNNRFQLPNTADRLWNLPNADGNIGLSVNNVPFDANGNVNVAGGGLGAGTVTTVSVVPVNGFSGTVATPTTTPAISIGTALSGVLKGTGTGIAVATVPDFPTLNQNTTGTASNITGVVAIVNGGTGQTTASNAITALLPTQATNAGKILQTNGTIAAWQVNPATTNGLQQVTDINSVTTNTIQVQDGIISMAGFNTLIGKNTNTNTGSQVTAVGENAAQSNTGQYVTALGRASAYLNTGASTTAIGQESANSNSGANAIAVGQGASSSNSGSNVTAVGNYAGVGNIRNNVFLFGSNASALLDNQIIFSKKHLVTAAITQNRINLTPADQTYSFPTANGTFGLSVNGIGFDANGNVNVGGTNGLQQVTDINATTTNAVTIQNVLIKSTNTTGIAIGNASTNATATSLSLGNNAGLSSTAVNVMAIGHNAANGNVGSNITAVGENAANGNTGTNIAAIGSGAAQSNSGNYITAVGLGAANGNLVSYVTAIGSSAAANNTGANSTVVGHSAGSGNTGENLTTLGWGTGLNNTGSGVVAIGTNNNSLVNTFNNVFLFGQSPAASANNQIVFTSPRSPGLNNLRFQLPLTADRLWNLPNANGTFGLTVNGLPFDAAGNINLAAGESPLTFSTGLTRAVNTITVNTSQNINTLSNLTTAGVVKTTAAGVLSSGALVAGDIPTIAQSQVTNLATDLASKLDTTTPQTKNVGVTTNPTPLLITGSINDFLQVDIKNISTGTSAQSGFSATADNGTASTGFVWTGKNNSGFNNPQTYNVGTAGDGSILNDGGNLWIHNTGTTGKIAFSTGNVATPFYTERMAVNGTGSISFAGQAGAAGQVLQSNGATIAPTWVDKTSFTMLSTAYTLASSTALQKLFNTTTNGAFNALALTTYEFECYFKLSGLSATSGTFAFGIAGTATYTSVSYEAVARKIGAIITPSAALSTTSSVTTAVALVTATTITAGVALITGVLRVNGAGTIIPSISTSVAAPAVLVAANSYFKITPIGTNTVTTVGNFT